MYCVVRCIGTVLHDVYTGGRCEKGTDMTDIWKTNQLTEYFKERINLWDAKKRGIYRLVGQNSAGKTTIMMITNLQY